MGKYNKKKKVDKGPKSRKEIRKTKRKEKKQRKFENYVNRNKPDKLASSPNKTNKDDIKTNEPQSKTTKKSKTTEHQPKTKDAQPKKQSNQNKLSAVESRTKELKAEKAEHTKLQRQMEKQRKKQLQAANDDEDRNIKQLEKSLRLNKRKTKSIPKSFTIDGLDYLLEVCDPENMKSIAAAEQQFAVANDEFDDDFALITGNSLSKKSKKKNSDTKNIESNSDQSDSEQDDFSDNENDSGDEFHSDMDEFSNEENDFESDNDEYNSGDDDSSVDKKQLNKNEIKTKNNKRKNINDDEEIKSKKTKNNKKNVEEFSDEDSDFQSENDDNDNSYVNNKHLNKKEIKTKNNKRNNVNNEENKSTKKDKNNKNVKTSDSESENEDEELDFSDIDLLSDDEESGSETEDKNEKKEEIWEDIYGRTRNKEGDVITASTGKYIPPALRNKTDSNLDKKQVEKIARIRRQLKGLLNRLAESNMHSIASQIEEMYMSNSRNNMNETLTSLIFEALISPAATPERLLLEHMLLITILHANVGTEVGAHFLQTVVHKFDELYNKDQPVENKELDNTVHTIAQLYNFKVFHSQLLYQILKKLSDKFEEKHVECILLVLKNVGFSLRKDDPLALKELILDLQKKAATVSNDNSRVKFMLDILLAIKNNNMNKIPNYDTSYSEHLKKISRNFIRKGNYVTQLNISLEDLLKAQERGRWWIVGSAWTGTEDKKQEKEDKNSSNTYNKKILELARKQRMNTDTRKNIFCALMTAENYTDAFEKILTLGLKGQQEREIIHVLLHCSLQEKEYNPYYSLIANKFCEYDRKYQMMIRCSIWDKLKTLTECSGKQISILAKLLTYLFINQGLPISTLKVIQFSELDQVTLRLIRQVLLGILLHSNEENCLAVFGKVSMSPKLKMFRESLRLFIHHFLLRNLNNSELSEENKNLLTLRAKLAEKQLSSSEGKIKL